MRTPCNNCPDRVPPTEENKGCHSYCEKYKEFRQECEKVYEKRKEISELKIFFAANKRRIIRENEKGRRKWKNE